MRTSLRRAMHKGETIISAVLALVVVLVFLSIQRQWKFVAGLNGVASSAENYILQATGIRGEVPSIIGYDRLKTYSLPFSLRAALYRSTTVTFGLSTGRFIIYTRSNQPLLTLNTLEGVKDAWTQVYDFAGRKGLPDYSTRGRPVYTRDLSGTGNPDLIVGQFSGGDQCCTVATVIELGKDMARTIGSVDGLQGWPFQGVEVRRIKPPAWQMIVHRSYGTSCGSGSNGADVLDVYNLVNGQYTDRTADFSVYLEEVLRRELAQWAHAPARTVGLLQTITAQYLTLGKMDQAGKFFGSNAIPFLSQWKAAGTDPDSCLQALTGVANPIANAVQ